MKRVNSIAYSGAGGRILRTALALFLLLGVGACSWVPNWANPVEWYRDATGVSKNDPTGGERNTENLEKGSQQPYPNLASVPPPPTNALSAAEREKLQKSLLADRQNAHYTEEGQQYAAAAPQSAPAAAPPAEGAGNPPPPAPQGSARGGEAAPQESPLVAPTVRSLPQGETPRPPPPAPAAIPLRGPAQQLPLQSAGLPPESPPPVPLAGARSPGVPLGLIQFAGDSRQLDPAALQRLHDLAPALEGGGTVRVIGYSGPGGGSDPASRAVSGFDLALDRARAVAVALTQMGIPARSVAVGASPAPPGEPMGAVALSLEH